MVWESAGTSSRDSGGWGNCDCPGSGASTARHQAAYHHKGMQLDLSSVLLNPDQPAKINLTGAGVVFLCDEPFSIRRVSSSAFDSSSLSTLQPKIVTSMFVHCVCYVAIIAHIMYTAEHVHAVTNH